MSVVEDVKLTKELKKICFDFVCNERGALIEELKKLKDSANAMHSIAFLNDIQRRGMEKATGQFVAATLSSQQLSNIFPTTIQLVEIVFVVFGKLPAINGFDVPLPVAVCSGIVNSSFFKNMLSTYLISLYHELFDHGLANSSPQKQVLIPVRHGDTDDHFVGGG
ncbi:hypothetical protein Tco_0997735 [Tanacetum coccineum]